MRRMSNVQDSLIEIGIGLFALVLLAGLGFLIAGKIAGSSRTGQREAAGPPAPGSVPDERQQHTAVAAVR